MRLSIHILEVISAQVCNCLCFASLIVFEQKSYYNLFLSFSILIFSEFSKYRDDHNKAFQTLLNYTASVPRGISNKMSIIAPHPTENEEAERNNDVTEIRCSTPIKEDNSCSTNGNINSNPSINTEVGAKRRKPLKTNKVTQQVQVL